MKLKRKSGILVHPTSFPSKFGIGDLGEYSYKFIDFLREANQKLWQILPLNPTSFGDSPYQCFSTFAGNYLLISPYILIDEGYLNEKDINNIPNFNARKVEYSNVISYKNSLFKKAYQNFKLHSNKLQRSNYNNFCKKNSSWLNDYALFVALKQYFIEERKNDVNSKEYQNYFKKNKGFITENCINDFFYGAVWNSWPEDIANREQKSIEKYINKLSESIEYEKFLQYEFFRQWDNLKKYANNNNIKIIGDLPIFVAMDSCDVWSNPNLFHLDTAGNPTVVAGVPPDYFSETGQLWGNPLYKWNLHKETEYKWWVDRISECLKLVDIIRIDHFRGFESYWAVKYGEETAINGEWVKGAGKDFFDILQKKLGTLPIIAEDLGLITPEVEFLRDSLNLPGMKILQFAFDEDEENDYMPHNISNCNCVIYTGTHDNDTTVGWYEKAPESYKDHFRRYMNTPGTDPAWDLIRLAFSSVASYAIIPIQDIMGLNSHDRMNTPGLPWGNWQFRYTEEMLADNLIYKLNYLTNLFNR